MRNAIMLFTAKIKMNSNTKMFNKYYLFVYLSLFIYWKFRDACNIHGDLFYYYTVFDESDYYDSGQPLIVTRYECKTFAIDSTRDTYSQMMNTLQQNGVSDTIFEQYLNDFQQYYNLEKKYLYIGRKVIKKMVTTIINDRYCSICFKINENNKLESQKHLCQYCGSFDHKQCLNKAIPEDIKYICWNCTRI